MRDPRRIRATYLIEATDVARAAALLAGEQSSGTFVRIAGETDALRQRHGAEVVSLEELGRTAPSLPSRTSPEHVTAARIVVEFPMETVGTDLATIQTTVAGNLFELGELFACRLEALELPDELVAAHAGPAFGVAGTRALLGGATGAMVGTIVKPNVGLDADGFRTVVRALVGAGIDLVKDDELMTDPGYLPLATRVAIAGEEIDRAAQVTGRRALYAANITGDLANLERRHDLAVEAGTGCVMLAIPVMGVPSLELLRTFASVPIHGHRAGLAASMRHPGLGVSYRAWQVLARLAGADHLHASGLGSKFSERDDEVVDSIRALQAPLGATIAPVPTLSSAQTVRSPHPTFAAIGNDDVLMLAGGGIIGHPDGPAAGVRSLRAAWEAAVSGEPLEAAGARLAGAGDATLARALGTFGAAA
ncbi:RuBisCO large subunit C-terminal-like domain-containing protein [Agrococcus jejuensis]|uniref:Ribulose-bisphosphate carboxylase large chain n=1 Tax=Agrococcus jejuensis TaxID=399736 RepID=A0A1G8ABQ4_9MICO|nr:RuBisCO large subunit C-terminal-like domain-containing protein [Agrococcus jejuensis]SDH18321.1 ribulose-bisphosphate carboxylase large chain [Agrococcus jejuensis]